MSETPSILAVTTLDKYLYVVSKSGKLLPLYYYGPLQPLSGKAPGDVPFLENWPDYTSDYAATYYPVPALDKDQLPDSIEQNFSSQPRPEDSPRHWEQAVYGGFPLYIYGDGTQDDPAAAQAPLDKAHLFARATTDLSGGPITGKSPITIPPSSLGP